MTDQDRNAVIVHHIGQHGSLTLRTIRGSVRVRGTDEEEVRVQARYLGRAAESGDPESDGILRIKRNEGELRIEVGQPNVGLLDLGRMWFGDKSSIDFDVDLPRGADLRLFGVSADLDVRGVRGEQEINTVSGDLAIRDASGEIQVRSVSGDVLLEGGAVTLDVTTTSGEISATVERLEGTRVRSVSGDVRLAGELRAGPSHAIESVSGDLELAPRNGVTVRMSGMSGSIQSDLPFRREPREGRGKRAMVIGDGSAEVTFRTMSGDAQIVDPSGKPGRGPRTGEPLRPPEAPRPAEPPRPVEPTARPAESGSADQLEILRALERGEIDVDEAQRRLEGARSRA